MRVHNRITNTKYLALFSYFTKITYQTIQLNTLSWTKTFLKTTKITG